jgi:hypothetical protein
MSSSQSTVSYDDESGDSANETSIHLRPGEKAGNMLNASG